VLNPLSTNRGKKHDSSVLVLERDLHAQSTMGKILAHQHIAVHFASTIEEAFTYLASESFDLLIAEFEYAGNGLSGVDFVERVREQFPHLPLIIASEVHDTETAVSVMRQGATDYLLKPIQEVQLMDAVARALTHRFASKQREDYQHSLVQAVASRTQMLREALDELEQACDFTLEALGDALDLRDRETEGHSRRVTAYTIAMARAMGLSTQAVKVIARGAFLHDIGKMGIPDSILLKPGPLTISERLEMNSHCDRGYAILKKIPYLSEAAEIVFAHQEHFDGSGYPRGLKGEEIHLGARIFAIADTLDAITSDRPYRSAQSFDYARKEIAGCAGTQFDPVVVSIYLTIPNSFWQQIRADILQKQNQIGALARGMEA
jgi:putative nucleotidyltransferase with HDIG domain